MSVEEPLSDPGPPAEAAAADEVAADDVAVPDDATVEDAEAAVVSDIDAVAAEVDAVRAERDDYLDALRRLQADFENYKKRMMRQQTDLVDRAAQSLVEKLLHVLDAADLAIAHGGGEHVAQVAGLLTDTLVKEGLEGVDPKPGDPFDPTVHDAVAHEPGDGADQEIVELMRPGYRWKGTLLRPAMVKVRG